MTSLSICSPQRGDGKTTVAAGLLSLLGRRGLGGYRREGDGADAEFLRSALGLAPTPGGHEIVEAESGQAAAGPRLIVTAFRGEATAEEARAGAAGGQTLGVIVNAVPAAQARRVERELRPALEGAGLRWLGALPETRALRGHTARELAQFLRAGVIAGQDYLDNVIETYMIGAMSHIGNSAVPYFERFQNKAVVTGGNRIDVHMAALGTPCQAIVLTGGFDPDPVVVERAEAESCPLIQVSEETPEVMDRIGALLRGVRFRHAGKVPLAADLLRQHVDLSPIEAVLDRAAAVK
jgi:BioD-like phosphotransacetylase family protein